MKYLSLLIFMFLSFSSFSQTQQDTCLNKDWYDSLQHSVTQLVLHDSLLQAEVDLLEKSTKILNSQISIMDDQINYEKVLRENAERNFNLLKSVTVSYQIITMEQSSEITKLKKNRWKWFAGGTAASIITFLIIK